jgi:hypothetical protein
VSDRTHSRPGTAHSHHLPHTWPPWGLRQGGHLA